MSRKDGICYCSDRGCPLQSEPIPKKDGLVEMLRASLAQHPNAKKPKAKKGTR